MAANGTVTKQTMGQKIAAQKFAANIPASVAECAMGSRSL
jgi:hypothetical protein